MDKPCVVPTCPLYSIRTAVRGGVFRQSSRVLAHRCPRRMGRAACASPAAPLALFQGRCIRAGFAPKCRSVPGPFPARYRPSANRRRCVCVLREGQHRCRHERLTRRVAGRLRNGVPHPGGGGAYPPPQTPAPDKGRTRCGHGQGAGGGAAGSGPRRPGRTGPHRATGRAAHGCTADDSDDARPALLKHGVTMF